MPNEPIWKNKRFITAVISLVTAVAAYFGVAF